MESRASQSVFKGTLNRLNRLFADPKGTVLRKIHPTVREQYRLARLTGPAGYWNELRAYQLGFMKSMGMRPHHSLLDIGCGPLQGGIAFISYLQPNKYVGIDVCRIAVTEGYKQIVKHQLVEKNPKIVVSNSFGIHELNGAEFDYVWTCQLLYHLDQEAMRSYFGSVSSRLAPGGALYADILGPEAKIPETARWRGHRHIFHDLDFVRRIARDRGLSMTCVGQIQELGYPVPCELRHNRMLQFQKP